MFAAHLVARKSLIDCLTPCSQSLLPRFLQRSSDPVPVTLLFSALSEQFFTSEDPSQI